MTSDDQYFKCNTCMACFASAEKVKEHYRSDWHSCNSKRRTNDLPPLKKNAFKLLNKNDKIKKSSISQKELRPNETKRNINKRMKKPGLYGINDIKQSLHFPNNNDNLLVKSSINEVETSNDSEEIRRLSEEVIDENEEDDGGTVWGDVDEDGEFIEAVDNTDGNIASWDETIDSDIPNQTMAFKLAKAKIKPNISLFDDAEFESTEECLEYMKKKFGFFIPDTEYLVDFNGLLTYLSEKIRLGGYCIYCQKHLFPGRPCQSHMLSKSHCKMRYEEGIDMDEFDQFYDFSSLQLTTEGTEANDFVAEETAQGDLLLPNGRLIGNRNLRRYHRSKVNARQIK